MTTRRPALFLDRDGVINVDHGYVHRQEDIAFVEGIFDLCRTARDRGYWIFVVTNQAGIGRGYYSEDDFHALTDWMQQVFANEGAAIDAVYFCPHHLESGIGQYKTDCECRKPKPGLLLQACSNYPVDMTRSILIGDKHSDIEAAQAAGVGRRYLLTLPRGRYTAESAVGATARVNVLNELMDVL